MIISEFEEDCHFDCPYCGESNLARIDLTGGDIQRLVVDCDTCCHPIVIKFERDTDGQVNFSAEKE